MKSAYAIQRDLIARVMSIILWIAIIFESGLPNGRAGLWELFCAVATSHLSHGKTRICIV